MSPAPSQTSTQAPTNRNLLFLTLGYACFVVACTQSFIPSGFSDSATESLEYRIANNVAFAAAYLVIALATLRRSSKRLPLAVPVAAGALVIVTQVLFFLCNEGLLELSAALVSVLHAATGSAMALLFSFWVSCAYLFDSRQFRYGILSGSLLSCFVVIFASGSNSAPAILSSQVIGLVISTTFAVTLSQDDSGHASSQKRNTGPRANVRDATHRPGEKRTPKAVSDCLDSLFMPALCTGILGFAYQYTWFFAKGNELTTLYYTVGEAFAVSLILLVVMMPDARPFSLTRAFRYLCPLTCLALVISVLAQGLPQGLSLSVGIASAAFNLSLILLIPLCADLGRKRSVSIPGLYAASACAVNLFPTLGYICGLYLEKLSAPWTLSIGIACVVVQVAIIYLGRNKNDVEFDLTISEAKAFYEYAKEQKGEIVFGRDYACRIIADEYGLSHRETEVLGMALQGKDAPGISDALGISRNTVRTHLQRIFQKTGLHSRQELVRLSENIEAGIRAAGEKDT